MKGLLTLIMLLGAAAATYCLPAKARHHYSETGVVYTTDYLTLPVPGGVVGFPAGSRLWARFNVHVPDKEVVTDGKYTLAIDPQTLTHDVEYAQELADADQRNQDQTYAGIEARKERSAATQHAAYLVSAQDIERINASMASSSTVGNYASALNHPTGVVGVYGSYGGGSGGGGGGFSGTYVNDVHVTQNNFNGRTASHGASAGNDDSAQSPGKITRQPKPVTGLSSMPMTAQ